ncbi:Zn-dependent peptidase ImmA (M78 family) [Sphingobium boeckii]|uniref:Zn-dependent peptidase ImmA (M78 family) n=2 Tax=Sphingobium boeckii TaxID=1082345 RepID=A0A7W9ALF1_9SPHN|nr:Zn-dependent peptidase ImmA (M78 family) [Sphingobium boeckii]
MMLNAIDAASKVRDAIDVDQFVPVDPYEAARSLGVRVTFLSASMEGFYYNGNPPYILLSNQRPLPRLAFTCAHELGHHWFGHGSSLDELQAGDRPHNEKPEEILANAFAAFFLMPSTGIRGAFSRRGITPQSATPLEVYTVACEYGVGYDTLISHLAYSLREIDEHQRKRLDRSSPQRIRWDLLAKDYPALVRLDAMSMGEAYDIEIGGAITLPPGCTAAGAAIAHVGSTTDHELFVGARRGVARIAGMIGDCEIRVQPANYIGLAAHRSLEDPDDD